MTRRIAVLYGGTSAEREVSLLSGTTIARGLAEAGYEPTLIDTADTQWLDTVASFDEVFIALHGRGGEDGTLQGMLQSRAITYSGSGVLGSALAMDKVRAKQLWQGKGIATPAFTLLDQHSDWSAIIAEFGRVFVKPVTEGSSVGMSLVDDAQALEQAWQTARQYSAQVLAEAYVDGPEYTVGILGERALPSIRVETQSAFYDYDAKYVSDATRYICPSELSDADELVLQQLSLEAFFALGCQVWGRVDVMRDAASGEFRVLEVNTVPGMTDHSLVPKAAAQAGIALDELVASVMTLSREVAR